MSVMKRIILAALVGVLVSGPAWAETDAHSGNFWKETCKREIPCASFVMGFESGFLFGLGYAGRRDKIGFCTPKGVKTGQMVSVFRKYLSDHPELLHETAAVLLFKALSDAFPCKK